jgi:hypothetical protein
VHRSVHRIDSCDNIPSRTALLTKFHHSCTNRLRAGQNAAVLLLDFTSVDIRCAALYSGE